MSYDTIAGVDQGLNESNFIQAKNDPSLRQLYIDKLSWKKFMPFVDSVEYFGKEFADTSGMLSEAIEPLFFSIQKKLFNKRIKIKLYSDAFDNRNVVETIDFLHHLYDNVGYQAKEIYDLSSVRDEFRNISFMTTKNWVVQLLLNNVRANKYAFQTLTDQHSKSYRMSIEKYIYDKEFQIRDVLSVDSKLSPKSIDKILHDNKPIFDEPIFDFNF